MDTKKNWITHKEGLQNSASIECASTLLCLAPVSHYKPFLYNVRYRPLHYFQLRFPANPQGATLPVTGRLCHKFTYPSQTMLIERLFITKKSATRESGHVAP